MAGQLKPEAGRRMRNVLSPDRSLGKARMERLLAAQMLYAFIVAALSVMVPLYLLEQKVDLVWIGIILSFGPISFMVIRIMLASMADSIGNRAIAALYSASNLIAIALYSLFVSPVGFALAALCEGVRNSGFWAISRSDILNGNGQLNPGSALARFSNMRQLADGLGRVATGFMLFYLAFTGSFALLFALSLALAAMILLEKGNQCDKRVDSETWGRISKKRPSSFWHSALLSLLIWLPFNMLAGFVFPLFLINGMCMGYQQVGITLAFFSLAMAASAIILLRIGASKRVLFLLTLLNIPAIALFPFLGAYSLLLLIPLGIGMGATNILGEYILVDQVYRSKDVNTDIGVLYAPLKMAEFVFLSAGGMVIAGFGFAPLFYVLAASSALFALLGKAILSERDRLS